MYRLQKHEDSGWEHLDGTNIKGRIVNGWATIVFEGYVHEGVEGQLETIFVLPDKYKPTVSVYFGLLENSRRASAYTCYINNGSINMYLLHSKNNVVGSVTYPIS
nr:MAG TPA: hypothetical protein [Caudoviricetes sp.]